MAINEISYQFQVAIFKIQRRTHKGDDVWMMQFPTMLMCFHAVWLLRLHESGVNILLGLLKGELDYM